MWAIGCQGATLTMSGVVPEFAKSLFDLTRVGNLKRALSSQAVPIDKTRLFNDRTKTVLKLALVAESIGLRIRHRRDYE